MIAYGWTGDQIQDAVDYANRIYAKDGGPGIDIRGYEVKSYRCRRGNHTAYFTLGFEGATHRLKDCTYPPGVSFNLHYKTVFIRDVIPFTELGIPGKLYAGGERKETRYFPRSTGHLCWHAFGHVFAHLFEINENGKIKSAVNTYDGRQQFQNTAGYKVVDRECDCAYYGLERFIL